MLVGAVLCSLLVLTLWLGLNAFEEEEPKPFRVVVVFDKEGQGDRGFNDMAFAGVQNAKRELGRRLEVFTFSASPGGDNREFILRLQAENGADMVIGVGYTYSASATRAALVFPHTHFVVVDGKATTEQPISNLTCLNFRANEGTFLVGAAAALKSRTGKIGFVGGMSGSLIQSFEAGYIAGARFVRPNVEIVSDYIGATVDAFYDPDTARKISLKQYEDNVDVIFSAAGASGMGVLDAANAKQRLMIGVDQDQSLNTPPERRNVILTSMVKRVDKVVYNAILAAARGTLKGGAYEQGLESDAVGYARNSFNAEMLAPIEAQLEEIKRLIIKRDIVPPGSY